MLLCRLLSRRSKFVVSLFRHLLSHEENVFGAETDDRKEAVEGKTETVMKDPHKCPARLG